MQEIGSIVPMGAAYFPVSQAGGPQRYAFLLLPQFTLLAFSSAVDPLRIANQLSQKPLYRWQIHSEDGAAVRSSSGVSINVDGPLPPLDPQVTLFVCSGNQGGVSASPRTLAALNRHQRFGGTLGGICTGAVTLARAGVLGGRVFTLHWENQPAFQEAFPDLHPTANKFESDTRLLTCGGGAAAMDMMIAIIERDHGADFAAIVSDMCLRRSEVPGALDQRSSLGAAMHTRNPRLIGVVRLMHEHIEEPLSLEALARRVGYSRRQIERQFRQLLDQSPSAFYRNLRLDRARSILADTDMSLGEVAAACGFESLAHFSRNFRKRFGTPPSRFNHHAERSLPPR